MTCLQTEKRLVAYLKAWADGQNVATYTQALKDARVSYVLLHVGATDKLPGAQKMCAFFEVTLVTQHEGTLNRTRLLEGLQSYLENPSQELICVRVQKVQMHLEKDNFTHKTVMGCQALIETDLER